MMKWMPLALPKVCELVTVVTPIAVIGHEPTSAATLEESTKIKSLVVTPWVVKLEDAEVRTPVPAVAPSVLGSPLAVPTWIRSAVGTVLKSNSE